MGVEANGVSNGTNGHISTNFPPHLSSLKVNQSRLMNAIHAGCEFGAAHRYGTASTETGMDRLSLNDDDRKIRDWFISETKALGCTTKVDQLGNLFAIRSGTSNDSPPVMMGSHLDTQPTGGRYDGILGVNAGLEVLKVLHENSIQTTHPIGVVNWTNEEGARFPMMAVASGVWADAVPLETAWSLAEVTSSSADGTRKTMKEELTRIGYLGDLPATHTSNPFAAHFELHIEQGPILEATRRKIGIVHGVQAFKWFNITVSGRDTHAGTTPFSARMDAMLCAAKCIVASNNIAKELHGLATTGILNAVPGSINTMAHTVTFSLDIRHKDNSALAAIEAHCREAFSRISSTESEKGCTVSWAPLVDSPAVTFHADCIACVSASAADAVKGLPITAEDGEMCMPMISGAGHDSCYTNRRCPTSMIFTPTREGVSHNPREYCSDEDCALGAQTLLGAILRYDELLKTRGGG
jgi:hydantoinase/carbamoylase family amidase